MKVRRVQTPEDVGQTYPCCTECPLPFWANGLPLSRAWFGENLGRHVEGLHLIDEDGDVIGHIYWAPARHVLAPYEIEDGVAYMYCEWVQRRHRGKGGMRLLFQEFVALLRSEGYKGILVDGTEIEGYMHYRHFLKRGFRVLQEVGGGKLLYYPLRQSTVTVKPLAARPIMKTSPEKVEVLVIGSRFCPVGSSAVMSVREVAQELDPFVDVQEVPANREAIDQYGVADGIFVDGEPKFFGPVTKGQVREVLEEAIHAGNSGDGAEVVS